MKVKPPVQGVPRELLSLETLWEALHLCVWRQGSPIQLLTEQFHLAAGVNTHDRVFCVTSIRPLRCKEPLNWVWHWQLIVQIQEGTWGTSHQTKEIHLRTKVPMSLIGALENSTLHQQDATLC